MVVPAGARGGSGRPYGARVPPAPEPKPTRFPWTTIAVVGLLATLGMYAWGWLISGSAVGVALIEIPLLLLITTPLFMRASRDESRFDLGGLLALGLIARFAAAYYRFTHAADAATYHLAGSQLAQSYRHLAFNVDTGSPVPGTGGMKAITGMVEVLTNSNSFATFLVFAWLGFFGCYLFYRAFVTALPDADHRRYALLIFLWPTLVYWPSSIGKDCWLVFTLGIAALGAARVIRRLNGGYTLFFLGLIAGSFVRPHVTFLLAVAFGVALLVGRRADRPGAITPTVVAKIAGLVVLLALGGYLATRTASLLDTADIQGDSVTVALTESGARTSTGGSVFTPADPTNPLGYVEAAFTVMFRPLPIEAHGTEAFVSSLEVLALAALMITSWKRLASVPRRLRSQPYVALAAAYLLMFFFAFGTISNFGILARERSQAMPFVFVLLALTALPPRPKLVAPAAASRARLQPGHRRRPR
jgi:hypothetical protein